MRLLTRFISIAVIAAAACANCAFGAAAAQGDPFALDFLDATSPSASMKPLWQVAPVEASSPGAFEDVHPDHWAYQAVKYLSDIGLMGGQSEGYFRGDRPVTRYELSVIIAKLVSNYNRFVAEGALTAPTPAMVAPAAGAALISPATPTMQQPSLPAVAPSPAVPAPAPAQPRPPKTGEVVWRDARGDQPTVTFQRRGPAEMQIPLEKAPPAPTPIEAPPVPAEQTKTEPEKKPVVPPKQFDSLGKKIELTEREVEILKALIEYVEKDAVKNLETAMKKEIADVRRQSLSNKREIERLKDEQQRFKITGSASAGYSSWHVKDTSDDGDDDANSYAHPNKGLSLDLYSKPRKTDDMTLRSALTYAGGGFIIQYQNLTAGKDRNFTLRNLSAGEVSFGAWFLTGMGVKYDGVSMEFKLNDYSIKSNLGKIRDKDYIFYDLVDAYYNREYIQAHSIQSSLFGNPNSLLLFTRIATWEDQDKDIKSSWYGAWYPDISESYKFFKPPMKNSVNSVFLRYPLPLPGLQLTTEYAHSTYQREGFKLAFSPTESSDFSLANKYVNWVEVPNMSAQDDAFYVFFDYAKGPIQILPMGYAKLGGKFVSRYFGLPGFSMDSLGIDILPINLQSLEIYLFRGTYKRVEKKFQNDVIYITGGEWKPMHFDTAAVAENEDMAVIVGFNLFERLNNRDSDALLKLSYFDNKFTYYLTDKITLSGKYNTVKAGLGPTCVDGNYTSIVDDQGNTIDKFIGNGIADCNPDSPTFDAQDLSIMLRFGMKSQAYEMFWRTSKKSDFTYNYSFDDIRLNVVTSVAEVNKTISDLVPQGRKYTSNFSYRYRLTDVSRVDLWYRNTYPRDQVLQLRQPKQDRVRYTGINITMSF